MNKKSGIVIAVMLLLFLGTGTFVFANPSEDEINGTGNSAEETIRSGRDYTNDYNYENEDDNQSILDDSTTTNDNNLDMSQDTLNGNQSIQSNTTTNSNRSRSNTTNSSNYNNANNNNNNGNNNGSVGNDSSSSQNNNSTTNNNGDSSNNENNNNGNSGNSGSSNSNTPVVDNTYNDALDALINAGNTLNQKDLNDALDLINKITDENKKNELIDRLNNIQNIINVTNLVNNLENMVNNAKNKNDINNAINYRNNEQIINQVNNLVSNNKNELLEKLNNISKIIDDISSPVIEGINNGEYTNESVSLSIKDDNGVKIYLNDKEVSEDFIKNLTEDGNYNIKVVDKAFNETNISFTIDKVAPSAEVVYSINNKTNQDVIVSLVNISEEIKIINNNGNKEYTFTENGEFVFIIEDLAGNRKEIVAKVDNIDKDAPVYNSFGILNFTNFKNNKDPQIATENDEILVFVTFNEKLSVPPIIEINGMNYISYLDDEHMTEDEYAYIVKYHINKDEITEGNINIVVKDYFDEANNKGEVLTNDNINDDRFKSVYVSYESNEGFEFIDGASFNNGNIIITNPDYAYMKVYNWQNKKVQTVTEKNYTVTDNTMYTFALYDKNDNLIEHAMMVFDNIKPKIVGIGENNGNTDSINENGNYDNVKLTITDNDLYVIKRVYADGSEEILKEYGMYDANRDQFTIDFTEKGIYKIVAVDRAGNEQNISFSIKESKNVLTGLFSMIGIYK